MTVLDTAYLIDKMQQSEFYPHPTSQPIELIQTHISYVFLTGKYAYKIKKAVNFGFLDFSSLDKRKKYLEAEISLNKEIAPEIYLEVIPITKTDDSLRLNGSGEIVEYASKMRQFPQENLFSNLFAREKLTLEHIKQLGKTVAQFHQQAKTSDRITSFGTINKIKAAFDENYQQTINYIGKVQSQQQYKETKAFTDKFFIEQTSLFKARQNNNKIRECHGDLHLKNICLWQNKIQLFDRIEFNEQFRFVDVMYDVAFVVMDLDIRGNPNFANVFLNTYLEQTGDWEGLLILPLYLSRQAYVRAKVTSFLLDDPHISSTAKQEATNIAANYYYQAWKYTKPHQGKLLLMSGLSGSGKTTVAKVIASQTQAIHLRSDAVRKHLAGIPLEETGGNEIYTAQMSQKTYDRLLQLGTLLTKAGFTVILDAKYDRLNLRQSVITAAKSNLIPLQIIHCTAPIDILRDRLDNRSGDISDATANLLSKQQATAEAFTEEEQSLVTKVDTSQANWREKIVEIYSNLQSV